MKTRDCRGVSLVQVLASMLIIAILALIAMPMMSDFLIQYRLKSAAEVLYGDILRARAEAIQRQSDTTLVFSSGSTWCYGITTASNCDCSVTASCNLGQTNNTEFSGVTLSSSGFSGSSVVFNSVRGVVNTTGSFILTGSDGKTITVQLNKLGLPSVCSTDLAEYPPSC